MRFARALARRRCLVSPTHLVATFPMRTMASVGCALPIPQGRSFFIETYGCQMNSSDSEVVSAILLEAGHVQATGIEDADIIMVNTCAIRENAEAKIWHRLAFFNSMRKSRKKTREGPLVGVLGCMAERLKDRLLLESSVDFVCGPDAYRDVPRLVEKLASTGQKEANTVLSIAETYADIRPVREAGSCSAFVSIMRGCVLLPNVHLTCIIQKVLLSLTKPSPSTLCFHRPQVQQHVLLLYRALYTRSGAESRASVHFVRDSQRPS